MLTGPKMQDEIQSLVEKYQQNTTDHLNEIDQFMKANALTSIKDIPKFFPDSPNIIDDGAKLYRASLILKGQFAAVDLALKHNLNDLKAADPEQLAQLLQNKPLLDLLQNQGEKRAELSQQLNTVTDRKGKEEVEQEMDAIFEDMAKLPKMEQLVYSYFQFNAMAQQNMHNLQTLPALLAGLTQAMQASQDKRVQPKQSKNDEWDEFGDEFEEKAATGLQLKARTPTTVSFDPEDDDSEEDWDAEFDVAPSQTTSATQSPADSDEDSEDWDAEFDEEPIQKAPLKLPESRPNALAAAYEHKRTRSPESGSEQDKPQSPDASQEKQDKKKVKPGGRSSDPN